MLDIRNGHAESISLGDAVEFPRIASHVTWAAHRVNWVNAASWRSHVGAEPSQFHGIHARDTESGRLARFDYGADSGVKKHIVVPESGSTRELDAWLVGTRFDAKRPLTIVNVLEASRVVDTTHPGTMRRMQIQTYLQRLAYSGPVGPDLETLRGLHLAHLRRVAFENLSIHAGQPIVLDPALLYRKIVEQGRGGFCYELNGLFAQPLDMLGFRVSRLAAEVAGKNGEFSPEFDHMALRVQLDEDYLVDVGFGDCFELPLRLEERGWQVQGSQSYRLSYADGRYTLHHQQPGHPQGEAAQYRFKPEAHPLRAFEPRCNYHQTSPDSHFTQKRICSMATRDGRISLSDLRLIVTRHGERVETLLASEQAFTDTLRDVFGIVV